MRSLLSAFAALLASATSHAQPADRIQGSMTNNMITLTDAQAARPLIRPNLRRVINDTPLIPQVVYLPAPGGFDLRVTYTNHEPMARPLGSIVVPGTTVKIPGYMVPLAFLYAGLGTILGWLAGRPDARGEPRGGTGLPGDNSAR